MASEDITFCANVGCADMGCFRNPKHIRIRDIPHSFALFTLCPKWKDGDCKWLMERVEEKGDIEEHV
jgi:hypothetical protein